MKLCDIGRVFEVSRHFSCCVPPELFTFRQRSGVHCFKRQILALMCQELLGDGNLGTSSYCESQNDPPSVFSGSSPSSSPPEDGAELATPWQNENTRTDAGQADITRKRKRQITDEVFHITTFGKDSCFLPCEVNTCQRARVFVRRNRYLCSRTYITWPFNRNDPPPCVMSPPCRAAVNTSASLGKPCLTPQESRRNTVNTKHMVRGDVRTEQVVVPSLSEESEVKSSPAQRHQLTRVPGTFHQSYHDESACTDKASARGHTSWVSSVSKKPIPAEQETPSLAQGQDPSHGESWSIRGRLAVDTQSSTSSEDDLSIEGCQRDKSDENDETEDADEDTFDGSEVTSEMLDALCSPSHTATAHNISNEIQVHEQDAIVLDVIDDDPDLFGSMMTDVKDNPVQTRLLPEKGAPNFRRPASCTKTASKLSHTDHRYVNVFRVYWK